MLANSALKRFLDIAANSLSLIPSRRPTKPYSLLLVAAQSHGLVTQSSADNYTEMRSTVAAHARTARDDSGGGPRKSPVRPTRLAEANQDLPKQIREALEEVQRLASETNLLALNATIEEARHGEEGKEFSVVAARVKDIASEVGALSSEVENIISDGREDLISKAKRVTFALQASALIAEARELVEATAEYRPELTEASEAPRSSETGSGGAPT